MRALIFFIFLTFSHLGLAADLFCSGFEMLDDYYFVNEVVKSIDKPLDDDITPDGISKLPGIFTSHFGIYFRTLSSNSSSIKIKVIFKDRAETNNRYLFVTLSPSSPSFSHIPGERKYGVALHCQLVNSKKETKVILTEPILASDTKTRGFCEKNNTPSKLCLMNHMNALKFCRLHHNGLPSIKQLATYFKCKSCSQEKKSEDYEPIFHSDGSFAFYFKIPGDNPNAKNPEYLWSSTEHTKMSNKVYYYVTKENYVSGDGIRHAAESVRCLAK